MLLLRRITSRKRAGPDALRCLEEIEELLGQGYYSQAYKEAEKALEDGNDKERCLRILGGAAYGMRKWELSVAHYEELMHAFPSNEHAKDRLLAAPSRLTEARTGNYDFARLFEAARRGEMDVDVADYVGPIEVVDVPGKGKGIVATRDIKKGTLLIVSKAHATATSSMALATATKEKLERQPERISEVAGLYYGCERSAATTQETNWKSVTDPTRLGLICSYNAFLTGAFNRANTDRTFYGDVMTAFTLMDIKQGEELSLGYTPISDLYEQRKSHLAKYDVVCDCRLCELDREDPRRTERQQLAEEITKNLTERPQNSSALHVLTRLVDQLRETYASRPEDMRTQLYYPLKALANAHQAKGEHDEAVKYLHEAVRCVPDSLMPLWGVWAYAQAAVCCDRMRRPRTARRYARMAVDLHRIRSGHDDELFKKVHTANIAHLL
ncbi:TPR domain-containing protein [Aphelenchoides avenae]|nr:TPR domain-containing protein [Aphelenchus avenae]